MLKIINRQKNLRLYYYYYTKEIDGIEGSGTKEAYRRFQADNGLSADGIYGQQTEDKLILCIKNVQSLLNGYGYNLTTDGIVGDNTINAVKDFQSRNGLSVDGIVGKNTMGKLQPVEKYRYPVNFIGITQYFKEGHKAIDLGWNDDFGGKNVSIYSCGDGEVIENGYRNDRGNFIQIRHFNGDISRYCHLEDKSPVEVGHWVKMGQEIGHMGNTGTSAGNHLHFVLEKNGSAVNPVNHVFAYPGQYVSSKEQNIILYV